MIPIAYLQKLTLQDFPGKVACIVFLHGCNFRCRYCYNRQLVLELPKDLLPEEEFLSWLEKRAGLMDGVVVTGGEPTIHSELPEFLKKIKELELAVKLDTNGANFEMLRGLIEEKLVDYVAMDVKAPLDLEEYRKVVGPISEEAFENVLRSIDFLLSGVIDYEFRTTVLPALLPPEKILKIAEQIKGAKRWYLQNFLPENTLDPSLERERPYTREELEKIARMVKKYVENVSVRGLF